MILIYLLLFQQVPLDSGIVYYKNSRVFFRTMHNQVIPVQSWETLKTPTDQVIQVTYQVKNQQIYDLKLNESFRKIYFRSNQAMKAAEKLFKLRQFEQSLDSLKYVQKLNPYIPYLYSNLFYVLIELGQVREAQKVVEVFKKKRNFLSNLEQSVFYYDQYEFWRNRYGKSDSSVDLTHAIEALKESNNLKPDDDKLRLLNLMESKIRGNQQ